MRAIRILVVAAITAVALGGAWLYYFSTRPVALPSVPFDFTVHTGTSVKALSRQLAREGVLSDGYSFWMLARLAGKSQAIQAGVYRLEAPLTPLELLDKLARGDVLVLEMR